MNRRLPRSSKGTRVSAAQRRRRGSSKAFTGWSCSLRIEEVTGGSRTESKFDVHGLVLGPRTEMVSGRPAAKAARKLFVRSRRQDTASLLASIGSIHRLAMLQRLLQGAASYQELLECSGLKAGPLYHHIAALRMTGLIGAKVRNSYQLTELGRQVAVLSAVIPKLIRQQGRR